MNWFIKLFVFFWALVIGNVLYLLNKPINIVKLDDNTWWGPGTPKDEDTSIKPFTIKISEKILDDLQYRLQNHRPLIKTLEGIQQQYGINNELLTDIVDYWRTKYNWREREKFLNQYPQFQTNIQGLNIHYLHVKQSSKTNKKVIPLLILHGWPGSIREFYELIPLLITPNNDYDFVFELIIPSLPGYGFSDATTKPGLGAAQMAIIFNNLMKRLKFDQYYVQGGDWGSVIASYLSLHFPNNVKGIHLNMCVSTKPITMFKILLGNIYPPLIIDEKYKHKLYPISSLISNIFLEFGYMHIQATKPDTIGVALTDSPIGLAAYFLEKFSTWTSPKLKERLDGGLKEKFTYTKLLDNIMIYWVTNSITTSMRLYSEYFNAKQNIFSMGQIPSKTACALFDHELFYQPENLIKDAYPNLMQVNYYDGGHFAAFEVPEMLAKDVWLAIKKFQKEKE